MLSNQQVTDELIEAFQRERSEWHSAPIREILAEYEMWRSAQPLPSGYEEWSLTFYGSPPSVMVRAGIPGLPDSRRDIAFMEFASSGDRTVQGGVLSAVVDEHNSAITTLLSKLAEVERERGLCVGDAVECVSENIDEKWRDDWARWTGFLASISVGPSGVANYTVSDHWPPKNNGDLTDGFSANQLRRQP